MVTVGREDRDGQVAILASAEEDRQDSVWASWHYSIFDSGLAETWMQSGVFLKKNATLRDLKMSTCESKIF
jgi:hypothetical protein